jgi:hypothetical protein
MAIPTIDLQWATSVSAEKIAAPTNDQKLLGYQSGDYPTQGEFNYLFNGYYQWTQYLTNDVDSAVSDVSSISETFVYLDDVAYSNITDPTANDKINKKVSDSQDIAIQSTGAGAIEGLDYNVGNSNIDIETGSCYMYKAFSTSWNTPILKFESLSPFTGVLISGGNWAFFGSGGIVSTTAGTFSAGAVLYVFALGTSASTQTAYIADTSSNGSNAVTDFATTYAVATDTVFTRRVARIIIGLNNEVISLSHKGNYTSVRTSDATNNLIAGRYVHTDTAGVYITPTAALLSGSSANINLTGSVITPILSQSTIDLTVSFNGTATNRHTLEFIDHIDGSGLVSKESASGYSTNAVSVSSGTLLDANTHKISVSRNQFSIKNVSTGVSPASDVLYLDVAVNGWTDYREQYKIG